MKVIITLLLITIAFTSHIGGYNEVDIKEYENNSQMQSLLQFGQQQFIRSALEDGKISSPEFTVQKVVSVYEQVVAGMNYKFNVVMQGSDEKDLLVTLNVFYQPWSGDKQLKSYTINEIPEF